MGNKILICILLVLVVIFSVQAQSDLSVRKLLIQGRNSGIDARGGVPMWWDGFIYGQYSGNTQDCIYFNYTGTGNNILNLLGDGSPAFIVDKTGATTITGPADGGLTSYDLKVGDTTTPSYGMVQIGNSAIGRTSYSAGNMDLNGSVLFRNIGGPETSQIEFIFCESAGNTTRFAIPSSGVGNATYNARSMLIAGPAPANTNMVTVGYWQTTNNIFDNLVCDTSGIGADLGIQNDFEVEGDIFVDSIKESTVGAGLTIADEVDIIDAANPQLRLTHTGGSIYTDLQTDASGDLTITPSGARVLVSGPLRTVISEWYTEQHFEVISLSPGGSGASQVVPTSNTLGGYNLDGDTEYLYLTGHVHSDWDAASDLLLEIEFEVDVDNSGGNVGDEAQFDILLYYKTVGQTANKTQTPSVTVIVGQSARYKLFEGEITIDYDLASNVVEIGDILAMRINFDAGNSDITDVVLTHVTLHYQTAQVKSEI